MTTNTAPARIVISHDTARAALTYAAVSPTAEQVKGLYKNRAEWNAAERARIVAGMEAATLDAYAFTGEAAPTVTEPAPTEPQQGHAYAVSVEAKGYNGAAPLRLTAHTMTMTAALARVTEWADMMHAYAPVFSFTAHRAPVLSWSGYAGEDAEREIRADPRHVRETYKRGDVLADCVRGVYVGAELIRQANAYGADLPTHTPDDGEAYTHTTESALSYLNAYATAPGVLLDYTEAGDVVAAEGDEPDTAPTPLTAARAYFAQFRDPAPMWALEVETFRQVAHIPEGETLSIGLNTYEYHTPHTGTVEAFERCKPEEATHAVLNLLTYGDYVGSTVTRANHDEALERYAATRPAVIVGGYGYRAVLLSLPAAMDAAGELKDYPVLDDDRRSELETELENETVKDWAARELMAAILKRLNAAPEVSEEDAQEAEDLLNEDDGAALLYEIVREGPGDDFIHESATGPSFQTERVAERLPIPELLKRIRTVYPRDGK